MHIFYSPNITLSNSNLLISVCTVFIDRIEMLKGILKIVIIEMKVGERSFAY